MARTKRVTLRQVADHAKGSPMKVSNFVSGRFDLMTRIVALFSTALDGKKRWHITCPAGSDRRQDARTQTCVGDQRWFCGATISHVRA